MAKILFIDRSAILREIAIKLFEHYDHEVIVTNDPKEALELFETHQPQLVVAEYKLPRITDLCLKSAVNKMRQKSKIFLLVDGNVFSPIEEASLHGVDMVFGKPFQLADILNHL